MSNFTFWGMSGDTDTSDLFSSDSGPSVIDEKLRNISDILRDKFPDINIDIPSTGANFLLFMCSLVFGMVWITYITFFNSRIVGNILTRIVNRFVTTGGHVKVLYHLSLN